MTRIGRGMRGFHKLQNLADGWPSLFSSSRGNALTHRLSSLISSATETPKVSASLARLVKASFFSPYSIL